MRRAAYAVNLLLVSCRERRVPCEQFQVAKRQTIGEFGRMMTGIKPASNDAKVDIRPPCRDTMMANLDPVCVSTAKNVHSHADAYAV